MESSFWRMNNLLVIVAMLVSLGAGLVQPAQAAAVASSDPAPIQPDVHVALERKGEAEVLVILETQASLSATIDMATKREKGTFVYQELVNTARRSQAPLAAFLDARGATYHAYWIVNMFRVTADAALVEELARQPGVARIEIYNPPYPDVEGHDLGPYGQEQGPQAPAVEPEVQGASIPGYGHEFGPLGASLDAVEWNIARVHADSAWEIGIDGSGVVIGNLDTGVQWDHPALVNQYRPQIAGAASRHDYNWYNGGMAGAPTDYNGHGTHTMGTIIGDDGGENQIGVAPGAQWIACPGVGSPYVGPFECFEFFLAPTRLDGTDPRPDLAPHVISNSWSGAGTNYQAAIQVLYAAGIFFSKSAGNTGPGCSTVTNPGQWPEVTAVANFMQGDAIASSSSRGPVTIGYDQYVKPDLAAPGTSIRSSIPGSIYGTMSGTSMACPHVTGAVALLINANPELAGKIDVLQMILKQTAEPKISAQCTPFVDVPNNVWGWGILNVEAAVGMAQKMTFGGLQGAVIDGATSLPIPGAELVFEDTATNWQLAMLADANGDYWRELPGGTYDLTGQAYGYLPGMAAGVVISAGVTVTQEIVLLPAPVWNVSGQVTEDDSGDPLAASITFVDTPVAANTDPATGVYTAAVPQGTWWVRVESPGHASEVVQVVMDQDRSLDFALEPVFNYAMRAGDALCGAPFNWIDATGGAVRNLSDDAFTRVALGKAFTFYGAAYTDLYVGSNGIVTFGSGNEKWSGTIPSPDAPNNGIYAFSTDLNPKSGAQGKIYTLWADSDTLVIEWHQVQHYPSGNPETFEIILDFKKHTIKIQYLVVSSAADVVAGVENAGGSEATQYAYNDPLRIAAGEAVIFYPAFGTPPPVGAGTLSGTVTDLNSALPIQGASVWARMATGGMFEFITGSDGTYTGTLCTDQYNLYADALGYAPSEIVESSVAIGATTVQDFALLEAGGLQQPEPLTQTLVSGTSGVKPLDLVSTSSLSLPFATQILPVVGWLSLEPASGTVPANGALTVNANFNASGMAAGVYTTTIEIAAEDPDNPETFSVPVTLTVTCDPVHGVDFAFAPEEVDAGEAITFTANASGTAPILYAWDFGDGATDMGAVVTHTYAASGEYAVALTAANCGGASQVVTHTLHVASACTGVQDVALDWTPVTPTVGMTVTFDAAAQGTAPYTFAWEFSDGFAAEGARVAHAFESAGVYTITLTVDNCAGVPVTVRYFITVAEAPQVDFHIFIPVIWRWD